MRYILTHKQHGSTEEVTHAQLEQMREHGITSSYRIEPIEEDVPMPESAIKAIEKLEANTMDLEEYDNDSI